MTVVGAPSGSRRRLAAAAVVSALAASLAGADLVSRAGDAEAQVSRPSDAVAGALSTGLGSAPVAVPHDVAFELDVVPVAVTRDPRPAAAGTVQDVAAATLARLPASDGVALRFADPRLGSHLGGVFLDDPSAILIGASRLAGDPGKTADVVRHEIAHIYQARLMTTLGYDTVVDRMDQIFGRGGLERAADCVAIAFGATWTHYTSDCAGAEQAAAIEALVAGRMP